VHFSLCDYLLDIVQNSMEAGADSISVFLQEKNNQVSFRVTDNGKGMDAVTLKKARDPFYSCGDKHAKRKVGLGLPFLIHVAQQSGGEASIESASGKGTTVACRMDGNHLDFPPLGNIASAVMSLCAYEKKYELQFTHQYNTASYSVLRSELLEALGDLNTAASLSLAKKYIESCEENLYKENRDG
jgi:hypothetical protein